MTLGAALGELFRVGSSKRVLKSQWQSEGVPFYRGREITRLANDGSVENELFISESLYTELASQNGVPDAGDIMVTAIGTIGNSYVVRKDDRFYFKDASVLWLKKTASVSSEFINYWLKSDLFFGQLDRGNGATVDTLTIQKLQAVVLDLPPPPDQRRIVAILDEAFEGIATAKANAEKNLRNARELFNSSVDLALSHKGNERLETTLGDEVEVLAGFAFRSKGYVAATGGVRLLCGDNIMQGYLRWDDAKAWPSKDCAPYSRFGLQVGDVVLAMDRPWVKAGLKRAQLGHADLPSLLLQRTARLRPTGRMTANFLFHLTGSQSFSRHLLGQQTGSGVPHISGKQIEGFRFMLPPMAEQRTIASALDEADRHSQRLGEICERKLAALDKLKKSLLHQAFSGAL